MIEINSIGFDTELEQLQATALASQLQLTIDQHAFPRLSVTADKLVLLVQHFSPLFVDFNHARWQKRRDAGKKQGLVQACKPVNGLRIIDATAGWGRDAAILASFGAEVLMIERQPILAALLADGLHRLTTDSAMKKRLSLVNMDAKNYLQTLAVTDYPDVIYIDPMHPMRQKSALVKKDMQVLQQFVGVDHDAEQLINIAITRARQCVVVKWPQRLPALITPNRTIEGKTVRFDVYIPSTDKG